MSEKSSTVTARFVDNNAQKTALTNTTPLPLTAALHRLYPFLIIWDHILNMLLWITEDTPLQIVNLLIICIALRYLLTERLQVFSIEALVSYLLASIATMFNWYSFAYYINTTLSQINQQEPPTLEDIQFVVSKINDKLSIIQRNLKKIIGKNRFTKRKFYSCVIITSPFQFVIYYFHVIDSKSYLIWLFISISLFNSTWVEVTSSMLWRLIWVRRVYYGLRNTTFQETLSLAQYITLKSAHTKDIINVDLSDLRDNNNNHNKEGIIFNLSQEIRNLVNSRYQNQHIFPHFKIIVSENMLNSKYEIIEITLQQNERKWYPGNWKRHLLSYERPPLVLQVSTLISKQYTGIPTLKDVEDALPLDWDWLENYWQCDPWQYYDTDWDYLGPNDSLNAYTRSRTMRRLIFSQIP